MSEQTTEAAGATPQQQPVKFEGEVVKGWALVELMGHRSFPGLVTEVTEFGGQMGRVRVPGEKPGEWVIKQDFSGSSVYGLRWGTEEQVRELAKRSGSAISYLALPGAIVTVTADRVVEPDDVDTIVDDDSDDSGPCRDCS